jgi:GT2 family glycosyltransferase
MILLYFQDQCEEPCLSPIRDELIRRGYPAAITRDLEAPSLLGIFACHANLLFNFNEGRWNKPPASFSAICLHDLHQDNGEGAAYFKGDNWGIFDLGLLPGPRWHSIYQESLNQGVLGPKLGVQTGGWPKADPFFQRNQPHPIGIPNPLAPADQTLRRLVDPSKKTILLAASWMNRSMIEDCMGILASGEFNVIVKFANWAGTDLRGNPWQERLEAQRSETEYCIQWASRIPGLIVAPVDIDIFSLLGMSDAVLSNGSNVMFEGILLGIPGLCVRDWVHPCGKKGESTVSPTVEMEGLFNGSRNDLRDWARYLVLQKESILPRLGQSRLVQSEHLGHGARLSADLILKAAGWDLVRKPTWPSALLCPEPPASPKVSIITPIFNQLAHTRNCLNALLKTIPVGLAEVVVVDNASSDGSADFLTAHFPSLRLISNPDNRGFVEACNQGAAAARGEFLLFLNNDTEPLQGWIDALLRLFQQHPDAGAAGARLVYPNGSLQEAGGLIFRDGSGWNFGRGEDPLDPRFAESIEVDYCSGAALMVRRELFEQLGGFDLRYAPAYYEDTDLCFGIRSLGRKVFYCADSIVLHHEGATAGTDLGSGYKKFQTLNQSKFVEKWSNALALQDPPPSETGQRPKTADRTKRLTPQPKPHSASSASSASPSLAKAPQAKAAPHVLIIDPFFPMHDKASGSLRLFQIVLLLRAMNYRVSYLARNGGNQEVYRRQLEAMGVKTYATDPEKMLQLGWRTQAPPIDLPRLLADCDIAWLSFFDIAEQYLPDIRALSPNTKILIDTVDVHFLRETRQAQLSGDPKDAQRADSTRQRELHIYSLADTVLTVTDADADVLRQAGLKTPITVIPNIHPPAEKGPSREQRHGLLFVGNFNHTPNVDAALWLCREILPEVAKLAPELTLSIVGTNPPPEVQALASDRVRVLGWVPEVTPHLHAARVSVAPLRVGAGMKGKIGEALSTGLPVVTTPIGAEGMGLLHEQHLLIAEDPASFAREIVRLHHDADLWNRLSNAGKQFVDARFGIAPVVEKFKTLLRPQARR